MICGGAGGGGGGAWIDDVGGRENGLVACVRCVYCT